MSASSSRIVFSYIPTAFGPSGNSAIRSADHENPTLEPNIKWIGWTVAEISPFDIFRQIERSVVGRSYIYLHWCDVLLFAACVSEEE